MKHPPKILLVSQLLITDTCHDGLQVTLPALFLAKSAMAQRETGYRDVPGEAPSGMCICRCCKEVKSRLRSTMFWTNAVSKLLAKSKKMC